MVLIYNIISLIRLHNKDNNSLNLLIVFYLDILFDAVIPFLIDVYQNIVWNQTYRTEKAVTKLIFKSGFFREIMLGPLNMF